MLPRLVIASAAALLVCGTPALAQKAGVRMDTLAGGTSGNDPIVNAPEVALGNESDMMNRTANLGGGDASSMFSRSVEMGEASAFTKRFVDEDAKVVMPVSRLAGQSYAVPTFRLPDEAKVAAFEKPSDLSARNSPLSSKRALGFDRSVEIHDYLGPEKDRVAKEMRNITDSLESLEDLPDRNLSIGEVKQLLNQYTTGSDKPEPVTLDQSQ